MKTNSSGFSLIELLITLILIASISLWGLAPWRHWLQLNRLEATTAQWLSILAYARSEAIRQGEKIIICASSDQNHCGGDWSHGLLIKTADSILRRYGPLSTELILTWQSSLGRNDRLEFVPSGFTNGQKGSFIFCIPNRHLERRIIIEQSGRARVTEIKTSADKFCIR